jgi:hypothetical protein
MNDVKGQHFRAVVRSRGARLRVERLAGFETRPKGSVWPVWAQSCLRMRDLPTSATYQCISFRMRLETGTNYMASALTSSFRSTGSVGLLF